MKKYTTIARTIKSIRVEKNLTQRTLAEMLGLRKKVGPQFISNCERGLCSLPIPLLIKICDITGVHSDVIKNALIEDFNINFKQTKQDYYLEKTNKNEVQNGQEEQSKE